MDQRNARRASTVTTSTWHDKRQISGLMHAIVLNLAVVSRVILMDCRLSVTLELQTKRDTAAAAERAAADAK
eukprot:scaffold78698_cov18-Tisochrysis_lutea.AAC.1